MKFLFDTNVIIDFLKHKDSSFDLSKLLLQHECFTSVIVKLELLRYPSISHDEEHDINAFLRFLPVISINESIENETIILSRSTKLKLPDAIIGATAIVYNAEIVTKDPHLLNCQYEKLKIWENI